MLSGPWKQKLIRYANTGTDYKLPMRNSMDLPKTILGRKITQRKNIKFYISYIKPTNGKIKRT